MTFIVDMNEDLSPLFGPGGPIGGPLLIGTEIFLRKLYYKLSVI